MNAVTTKVLGDLSVEEASFVAEVKFQEIEKWWAIDKAEQIDWEHEQEEFYAANPDYDPGYEKWKEKQAEMAEDFILGFFENGRACKGCCVFSIVIPSRNNWKYRLYDHRQPELTV